MEKELMEKQSWHFEMQEDSGQSWGGHSEPRQRPGRGGGSLTVVLGCETCVVLFPPSAPAVLKSVSAPRWNWAEGLQRCPWGLLGTSPPVIACLGVGSGQLFTVPTERLWLLDSCLCHTGGLVPSLMIAGHLFLQAPWDHGPPRGRLGAPQPGHPNFSPYVALCAVRW